MKKADEKSANVGKKRDETETLVHDKVSYPS
jgi:hypothetical protein